MLQFEFPFRSVVQVAVDVSVDENDPSVEEAEGVSVMVDMALLLSLPLFWRGYKALAHADKESDSARRPVPYRERMIIKERETGTTIQLNNVGAIAKKK